LSRPVSTLGIVGAGAWGTALAYAAMQAGCRVKLLAREAEIAEALRTGAGNPLFLPGIALPAMDASSDPASLSGCDALLAVMPAQHARATLTRLAQFIEPGCPVMLCAKGIEQDTGLLMSEVLNETLPMACPAVLSGPSFATDVACGLPTALTLACADETVGLALGQALGRPVFRPYWSRDVIGAEVGGAVKNVLAIACGMVEGLGLGRSAHAALMTRGFAEMTRLAVAKGGRRETVTGLCGLGDLVLTCTSAQSRNMSFGKALGEGGEAGELLSARITVTEGAASAPAIAALAERLGVEMPICKAVAEILAGQFSVGDAMDALLMRPFTTEE